jgi:hypothetical protein
MLFWSNLVSKDSETAAITRAADISKSEPLPFTLLLALLFIQMVEKIQQLWWSKA